eukprot:CAMPEP_0202697526 /NCGR_PEP_ID=MMETSP1385-20130828/10862_1 /ASSEMBLY_ACC=CAM_ASM_000861 /TAXON_ID=933848 /ORGANISM="Elphidium margaritaceum" /LENGTH=525 /DNA_ID=CAMNT_0049354013 /DNA_START=42 /DNA_END=1619 /DNA_ORIENTATION=+
MTRSFSCLLVVVSSLMSLSSAATAILQSSSWAAAMLNQHNAARRLVQAGQAEYNGDEGRVVQPPAVEMPDLTWSDSLAQDAADYAAGCPYPVHFVSTGENLAWSSSTNPTSAMMVSFVRDGFIANERPFYRYSLGSSLCDEGEHPATNDDILCGHYVQIIRAAATQVGCGYQVCGSNTYGGGGTQMVCRYNSPNWSDQYPYVAAATTTTTTASSGGGSDPSCLSVSNMQSSRYIGTFTPTGLSYNGHAIYENQNTGCFLWRSSYQGNQWVMDNKLYSLSASRFGSCAESNILSCSGKWTTASSSMGTFTSCSALETAETPECYLEAPIAVKLFHQGLIAEDDDGEGAADVHKWFSRDEAVGCYNEEPVYSYVALVDGVEVSYYLHLERFEGGIDAKWVLSTQQISTYSSPFCVKSDLSECVSGEWQTLGTGNVTADVASLESIRSMQAVVVYDTADEAVLAVKADSNNNTAIAVTVAVVVLFLAIIVVTVAYKVYQKRRVLVEFEECQAHADEDENAETVAMTTA